MNFEVKIISFNGLPIQVEMNPFAALNFQPGDLPENALLRI